MKRTLLIFLTIGCSSHAYSAGYAELEGGAAGAAGSGGSGGFLTVDANVADRIFDVYEATSTEDCPGSSACSASGYCVSCDGAACSARCACFASVYPDLYAGTGSCVLGGSTCQCERVQ